jgi:hypothetical protein
MLFILITGIFNIRRSLFSLVVAALMNPVAQLFRLVSVLYSALSGSNNQPVTIERIEASSALETLGLFTSPSGQDVKQFQTSSGKLLAVTSTLRQTFL